MLLVQFSVSSNWEDRLKEERGFVRQEQLSNRPVIAETSQVRL